MSEIFRSSIDAATRYCAVFGHPITHSASPTMQNAGIHALGLNWRYLAFDVHPEDLRAAIAGAQAMKFIGLNLTVPHKLLAVEMVDHLDESARIWGAVNTIRFEAKDKSGHWQPLLHFAETVPDEIRSHGFNTDAEAITRSLREEFGFDAAGKKVLVLGTGGAGRVAALKLASENVTDLFLINRTASKAGQLATEITSRFPAVRVALGYPDTQVDLLLNATSLGLKAGDLLPFDEKRFPLRQASCVYDMIYRPAVTPLLKRSRDIGCRTANGFGMLLYQGAKALEIWTGKPAPLKEMRAALEKNVYV